MRWISHLTTCYACPKGRVRPETDLLPSHDNMNLLLPPSLEHLQRHSVPQAERKLAERFCLNWDSQMQDWDITNANAELLPVFLGALEDTALTDDELYSLMALTIASADEALQLSMDSQSSLASLATFLRQRPSLYASTIKYWAEPALRKLDKEEQFSISEFMANVWNQILPELKSN